MNGHPTETSATAPLVSHSQGLVFGVLSAAAGLFLDSGLRRNDGREVGRMNGREVGRNDTGQVTSMMANAAAC